MNKYSNSDYRRKFKGNVVLSESGQVEPQEEWDFEPEIPEDDFLDEEELKKKHANLIGVRPTEFVEMAIKLPDKMAQKSVNFSFSDRRYLKLPYDTNNKRVLLKCGRQVEKSTLLGNRCLAYCCIINSFKVLYVSTTNLQTKTFSRDRLKEPMETSDIIKAWTTSELSDSVFEKQFINRSKITLRYAYHSADRVRGIPADMILIDEVQDINTDNIPVIEECASHSPFQIFLYSGTPKSLDNAIEKYWANHSTQNEWTVPCEHHGLPNRSDTWHWNILSEDNIGPKGLKCDRCDNLINVTHPSAQWVSMNPLVIKKLKEPYEGFRIPQIMVPWIPWEKILDKQQKYPRSQFYNEVLGLSYDAGTRPLTQADIVKCCDPNLLMFEEDTQRKIKQALGEGSPVYAGIDWGTGEGSFTVMSLGAYLNDIFTIFYVYRFEGQDTEPQVQIDKIQRVIDYWNIKIVATDYGGGFVQNDSLTRRYGKDKILKYQYSQPSQKIKWEPGLRRFLVHRTEVMSDIFSAIKRSDEHGKGRIFRFPKWENFQEPFAQDMLNIFSEYNEQRREIQYKKSPDRTDDTFHSILLCFIGSLIIHPRFDILNPSDRVNAGGLLED